MRNFILLCIIILATIGAFVSNNPNAELKDCQERLLQTQVDAQAAREMLDRHHEEYRYLYQLWWECKETLSACGEPYAEVTR